MFLATNSLCGIASVLDFYPIGDSFHETAAFIMSSTSLNHKWGSSAVDLSGQCSMLAIAGPRLNLPSQVGEPGYPFNGQWSMLAIELTKGYMPIPSQVRGYPTTETEV